MFSRRTFTRGVACGLLGCSTWRRAWGQQTPGIVQPDSARPLIPFGVASGDVSANTAVLWSRCDRPGRMIVEWATTDSFRDARRIVGPAALDESDFTAKLLLRDLPPGQRIFYRVSFQSLAQPKVFSEPVGGQFRTPSNENADVFFAWSADTCGQGFGINPDIGGMRIYETMRALEPHFFIHSGDTIYADNPIPPAMKLDDGTIWRNLTTPAKSKVAETLAEFRGNHAYNLLDENVRRFNADVPQFVQWDDHETLNNWYPGEVLDDPRYTEKNVSLLAARGARAFRDYTPISFDPADPDRIFRNVRWGPSVELFILDKRSYRGPNTHNRQPQRGDATALLGDVQLEWLKRKLKESRATWKVMCSDMPIGLLVGDAGGAFDNAANGNGPPLGRELEIAELLSFAKREKIRNMVWLTGDVHYAAAHYYDPAAARFPDFDPFWEFVAGPLNAGTFGPGLLDDTFGPQPKWHSLPPNFKGGRPPSDGLQFFGTIRIDAKTQALTTTFYNAAGKVLHTVELTPVRA
jgi:alkaline phosphatase D